MDKALEEVRQLAIWIHTCYVADSEVTIDGNGVNSGEALEVINEVLSLLGLSIYPHEVQNKLKEMGWEEVN